MTLLNKLPNDMTVAATAAASTNGANHNTQMLALIQEMQSMVTKSAVARTTAANDEITIKDALNRLDQDVKKMFSDIKTETGSSHNLFDRKLVSVFKDVMRFKSDLEGLHLSGIMISLHSGIVNKHTYQIERLSTGHFAMYLADNEYNMETVYNAIKILNEHDGISTRSGDNEHVHKISTETMRQAKLCLKEAGTKMDQLKSCAKTMISIVSDLSFEKIDNLLTSNNGQTPPITVDDADDASSTSAFHCKECDRDFKNKGGLTTHVKIKHPKK